VIAAAIGLALAAGAVACAAWLTPASIHIASWGPDGPLRIAYLAPVSRLWLFVVALEIASAAAAVVLNRRGVALREMFRRVSPLLLLWLWLVPFLPWLADRSPLLLVFAGPVRWAIGAAAAVGVVAFFVDGGGIASTLRPRPLVVFLVSFTIYATLGIRHAREVGFGGDEPHYLIITQSLIRDHDLDIANNHARRDYRSYFPGDLRPDFLQRGRRGEIYSIHAPGLPAALIPAFAAGGALGAVVFMGLVGALAATAIFEAAATLTTATAAAWIWIATCFTVPFVPHAWLIYPEITGALIVAWTVKWRLEPPPSLTAALAHGTVLAVLPWLHTKFALLLAIFAAFEALRLWPRFRILTAFAAPIALSVAAWLYSFRAMYGVFDPEAPYGSYTRMFVLAKNIPRGTLGLLFDQKFGLLVYSPVYLLAIAGVWTMLRNGKLRWFALGLLAAAAAFFVSTTRLYMWWGGSSAPARFLVPVVPLIAPMLAVAIAQPAGVFARALAALTIVTTLAVAVLTLTSPSEELLYSNPHGVGALVTFLQGSAPFDAALPTFTEENWRAPAAALAPWVVSALIAAIAVAMLNRRRRVRSMYWTSCALAIVFLVTGCLLASARRLAHRHDIVVRERLALMRDYDPARTHAVDASHLRRLSADQLLAAMTMELRRASGEPYDNPRVLEGPFELPEGEYQVRVWSDGAHTAAAAALVGVSDEITLARAGFDRNSATMRFGLPIPMPVSVGVTDAVAARAVRRVELAPLAIVPRSRREDTTSHSVEPIGGAPSSFMAYVDDRTYPEGGVFWTRDREEGAVIIATPGARAVRLILHVGPPGGPVIVDALGRRLELDLQPDETREIEIPLPPGTARARVSVRATKSFRPSAVDPTSDDHRWLGCQVRPLLVPR
jgi:hypothetical protein